MMYKHVKSIQIINILSNMILTVNYDKVLKIETNLTKAVVQKMEESNGFYKPPSPKKLFFPSVFYNW